MAIKSIDDLIAPVGMTEKENQKGLKITVPLEATNQNKEGMDFLATPLVTPTDINPAYNINEPGALDYADRFDFKEKTKKRVKKKTCFFISRASLKSYYTSSSIFYR